VKVLLLNRTLFTLKNIFLNFSDIKNIKFIESKIFQKMKTLVKTFILKTYLFSFLISIVLVIAISQIEVLDSVERGLKNLDEIFALSLLAYFPYVFFLSIPLSAFRFSLSRRKKLFYLMSFGFKPQKLFFFSALIFLVFSVFFSPLFYISGEAKRKLSDKKSKNQIISIYISEQKNFVYHEKKRDGKQRIFLISPTGEYSKIDDLPKRKKFIISSKSMDFSLIQSPQKFFIFSLIISFGMFFSAFSGISIGSKGIFVPVINIFLAIFITSIL
jgi:hypothetical protein